MFTWGQELARFKYDFDGVPLEIVKHHPWDTDGVSVLKGIPSTEIFYHCEELHESFRCIDKLLIAWIAKKNLGLNQHALVDGIFKALSE